MKTGLYHFVTVAFYTSCTLHSCALYQLHFAPVAFFIVALCTSCTLHRLHFAPVALCTPMVHVFQRLTPVRLYSYGI